MGLRQKLTKRDKEEIVTKILRHKFGKDVIDRSLVAKGLMEKILALTLSKKDKDLFDQCPDGWKVSNREFKVRVAGVYGSVAAYAHYSFGGLYEPNAAEKFHVLAPYDARGCLLDLQRIMGDQDLVNEIETFWNNDKLILGKIAGLKTKINAVLSRSTSTSKILAIWPDIEPFLPTDPLVTTVNLPATLIQDLNKSLDLPVETKNETTNG